MLRQLVTRYEALFIDAYGVLVNSTGPLPHAVEFVEWLNDTRKPYFIVTNDASRQPATCAVRYAERGLTIDADRIITSGSLLPAYFTAQGLTGARTSMLGPEDSKPYVLDAGGVLTDVGEDIDVLVVADEAGYPFLEGLDTILSVLYRLFDADRPPKLIVPNPDLVYPKAPGEFGVASGSIAALFEAALELRYPGREDTKFVRLGKPHRAIFEAAVARAGTRDALMIGDQLVTDIAGANAFGIDSALVTSGVTREVLGGQAIVPTHVLPNVALSDT